MKSCASGPSPTTSTAVLRLDPRRRPDHSATFYYMDSADWVNAIALTDADEVVMIEQFRHGSQEITLEIVHVPGHRPEQINLLVTDHSRGDDPWCILTADFVLVGDIARPDLAQGGAEGARTIFAEALPAIADIPDFVEG